MDWDDIRFFLAVARTRSISGAARDLHVDQTTVSRRIAALEQALAVRLFDRSPKGHIPTREAAAVLDHALKMDDEALALERRVVGRDARLSGRLRVTMSDVVAIYLLLPHLHYFRTRYPDIELEFVSSDDALNLSARQADVAVRITDRAPESLVGRKIATLRYAVYASKAYVKMHRKLDAPTVSALTWVSVDGSPQWLRRNFPKARVAMRFDSILSLVAAIRAGAGIALIPCFVGEQEPALVRIPMAFDEPGWSLWVLSHADLRATARAKAFRDFVRETLQQQRHLLTPRLT